MTAPAYNCVFGWPIFNDVIGPTYTPSYSGGSWQAANPLTNLSDRRLRKVARSSDALATSTKFEVDLGVARAIRVVALPYHTISSAGTIRVRGGSVAGLGSGVVYDSGTVNVWPSGPTAETLVGLNLGYTLVPSADQTARYWLIEITDTGNAAGYVDVGRLILAAGWQPSNNLSVGAETGLETDTTREVTDGGAAVFNAKAVRRNARFAIELLALNEALASGFDMMRLTGTSGQVHFVFDPTDTTHMYRRAFLATMRQLSPIQYPFASFNSVAFDLVEEL